MAVKPSAESRKENLAGLAADRMQRDGYSALGLRELAAAAGLKAASLYSHFTSKDEMAIRALASYEARQTAELEQLMSLTRGADRLYGYISMIAQTLLSKDRSCLALVLAVERKAVVPELLERVVAFADRNAAWLARAWQAGQADGSIRSDIAADTAGSLLFNGVEGAIAFSLVRCDAPQWFIGQADQLLQALGVTPR
jgi:Transcriptional regulator